MSPGPPFIDPVPPAAYATGPDGHRRAPANPDGRDASSCRDPDRPGDAVPRWGGGLPQYGVGHLDRVARVRAAVAKQPALAVAGATYDGLGIPACIASAHAAAAQVLTALSPLTQ